MKTPLLVVAFLFSASAAFAHGGHGHSGSERKEIIAAGANIAIGGNAAKALYETLNKSYEATSGYAPKVSKGGITTSTTLSLKKVGCIKTERPDYEEPNIVCFGEIDSE